MATISVAAGLSARPAAAAIAARAAVVFCPRDSTRYALSSGRRRSNSVVESST